MTEQEKINNETALQLAVQDAKFEVFMNESKEQREDIRRLNDKIDSKLDGLGRHIQNMAIAAIVGFGAIAVAVGGIVFAALK